MLLGSSHLQMPQISQNPEDFMKSIGEPHNVSIYTLACLYLTNYNKLIKLVIIGGFYGQA
ncbi:hypothetical protein KDH_31860 [Dictyobacter sp. S3.2.2.5]|uniref:Uncharacterized protein n=1 Tax=Dictyobacter halimunensis TaxID=3026934 RepID=A0ABQ6FTH9_9CHLR|nr:hypothetical protein KDH_31860 [Dictyobacter sp. S3.2.2.5]